MQLLFKNVQAKAACALVSIFFTTAYGATSNTMTLPSLGSIGNGTGYTAWEMCTRIIQGADQYDRVVDNYVKPVVNPLPLVWWINYQKSKKVTVSTVIPLLREPRVGYYRAGLGCTLIPNDNAADQTLLQQQAIRPLTYSTPISFPWPYGDQSNASSVSGAQKAIFEGSANRLFTENQSKKKNTIAFVVAKDNRLLYERYATGYTREMPLLGWSMTKTLTALVAGLMATDGVIQLDNPAVIPTTDAQKKLITWMNLLNMASGLKWLEDYTGGGDSDTTTMLFKQKNQAQYVADRPLINKPGTVFNYSTGESNLLMYGLKEKAGGSQAIYNYYQRHLFQPLGIKGGIIEFDYSGNPVGGARGVLRPIDWLRIGQLYLNQGKAPDGTVMIAPAVLEQLLQPSAANAGYAGQIWLRESLRDKLPASVFNKVPNDAFYMAGFRGQFVMIVPSKKLLMLRMGVSLDQDAVRDDVMSAFADLAAQM